jgi:gliding motility-associated-like protein
MKKFIGCIILVLLVTCTSLYAQEICDNGIDDDADGLVDLNDDDCFCPTLIPSSLIPNPSFEEMTCCPTANEMLECAVGWIQASAPTTDYVHTCGGYLGNTSIPAFAPLPFPDGEGGVGFRDGQAQAGINYKEYVGACLLEPMEIGATYRLDFFVGFRNNIPGSTSFNIAVFAANQCGNLPFGIDNYSIGCPVNSGDYVQIGEQFVSGSNEWVNVVFEFEATQAYEVIVLGPSCNPNSNFQLDPYFYVDRLALAESSEFGVPFTSITGSICENDLVLQVEEDPADTFQWYQDGVALVGETGHFILLTSVDNTEGSYTVVISTPEGCMLSQTYNLLIPPYYGNESVSICETESYNFGGETLTDPGIYETLYEAIDGCDSIAQLTLEVRLDSYETLLDTFCIGDTYFLHDIVATEEGTYETIIPNITGCDSIITLELSTIGTGAGIELGEDQIINLGASTTLDLLFYESIFTDFLWFDEGGNTLSDGLSVSMYQPVHTITVYCQAFSSFGCSAIDSMVVRVIPDPTLFVPNVFSPDGNGINDSFTFYPPISVDKVLSFHVFDRWGELVFHDNDISDIKNYKGWDGKINGALASQGVYCYMIHVLYLNGTEKTVAGDVLLLR